MRNLHYHLVDVFTDRRFGGNQLAVFTNGRGIPDDWMQNIARELNISETTFVLPPENPAHDYRVRIFTPGKEMPMAGHPTVGTAFVLAREGMIQGERAVFEERVGPIPVSISYENGLPVQTTMTQPLPEFGTMFDDRAALAEMLSLDPTGIDDRYPAQIVSTGVPLLFVPLRDLSTIKAVKLRQDVSERLLQGHGLGEVFVFTMETERAASTVHSRMFAPVLGIPEDPATGAASGPLGSYLVKYGIVEADPTATIIGEQGFEMGRPSIIHIEIDTDGDRFTAVRVGGQTVYIGEGFIQMP